MHLKEESAASGGFHQVWSFNLFVKRNCTRVEIVFAYTKRTLIAFILRLGGVDPGEVRIQAIRVRNRFSFSSRPLRPKKNCECKLTINRLESARRRRRQSVFQKKSSTKLK